MENKVILKSLKHRRSKKIEKMVKITLLMLLLAFVLLYFVFRIIYNSGNFTITLDRNLYFEKGIVIYDNPFDKNYRSRIQVEIPEKFDNISSKWLPSDIDNYEGNHNGDNYLAYSFYIENTGNDVSDYWGEILIDDVIKNVDEAIRLRVYKNGESVTYAKLASNGNPERDTTPFESNTTIATYHVSDFKPGQIDKYTIVLWLEGNDPECNDNILGGEIKLLMEFNSEFVEN